MHRSGKDRGLIGMAEIADIIEISSLDQFRSRREEHHAPDEFYQDKLFGWVLRNARPIDFIPCKGQLGIWEVEATIVTELEYLYGAALHHPTGTA